jgi:hypothetical protein
MYYIILDFIDFHYPRVLFKFQLSCMYMQIFACLRYYFFAIFFYLLLYL